MRLAQLSRRLLPVSRRRLCSARPSVSTDAEPVSGRSVSSSIKEDYIERLNRRNPVELRALNANPADRVDNDVQLDLAKVLETLDRTAIKPDRETFDMLAKKSALNNTDATGISETDSIITHKPRRLSSRKIVTAPVKSVEKADDPLRFDPSPNRTERISLIKIIDLHERGDIHGFRRELNEKLWPEVMLSARQMEKVFKVIILFSEDVAEIHRFIKDLVLCYPTISLDTGNFMVLLKRIILEQGIDAALEMIVKYREIFLHQPAMEGFRSNKLVRLTDELFAAAFATSPLDKCEKLCNALLEHGFCTLRTAYLDHLMQWKIKNEGFHMACEHWRAQIRNYRDWNGSQHLLDYALMPDRSDNECRKQIKSVFDEMKRSSHLCTFFAELVLALVRANRIMDAKMLMSRMKMEVQHFYEPIRKMRCRAHMLPIFERFADLLQETFQAEGAAVAKQRGTFDATIRAQRVLQHDQGFVPTSKLMVYLLRECGRLNETLYLPFSKPRGRHFVNAACMQHLAEVVIESWLLTTLVTDDFDAVRHALDFAYRNAIAVDREFLKRMLLICDKKNIEPPTFLSDMKIRYR